MIEVEPDQSEARTLGKAFRPINVRLNSFHTLQSVGHHRHWIADRIACQRSDVLKDCIDVRI
ncbi:hypothetical protein Gbfr_003_038 [Gluconobacter frateurii M-2]|nr:hypothetical protein Gbfr_003_038 [Gluconobacter frateurii M-2]